MINITKLLAKGDKVMSLNNSEIVKVHKIVNGNMALHNHGHLLYDLLVDIVLNKELNLIIDFSEVGVITTAFLNYSIGKFLIENDFETIKSKISFAGLNEQNDINMLRTVIEDANKERESQKVNNDS